MKWYFVRHGEIPSNVRKIYAGCSEEGLTARGWQQAREAAEGLACFEIGNIYTSPLKRAVQTAEIIGGFLNKQPATEENFKEMRLGPWEGMREEEIKRKYPEEWRTWNTRPAELVFAGRETLEELQGRLLNGLEKIKSKSDGKGILVVTHVAIIRVLLLHAQKMDLNHYRMIPVQNGEIFEIDDELLSYRVRKR